MSIESTIKYDVLFLKT